MKNEFSGQTYISASKIKKVYDISLHTLRKWTEQGHVRCIRTNPENGKRLYHVSDIQKFLGLSETDPIKKTLLYARVSSDHQKHDLERQIETLLKAYPSGEIIKDIGSGLNPKRKGLQTILELVYSGNVEQIVVTYKDRLTRFNYELIEWICRKHNTKLVVLNTLSPTESAPSQQSQQNELAEDLLSIITVFVAKNNGQRASRYRKARNESTKTQSLS